MKWTKDTPVESGHYWIRDTYGVDVVTIEVFEDGGIYLYVKTEDRYYSIPENAELAGPIPEPEG